MALKTIWLVRKNVPLSQWRKLEELGDMKPDKFDSFDQTFGVHSSDKTLSNAANVIVNSMSHPDAVDLVAKEWNFFPSVLRMYVTMAMNEAFGTRSGNKTKGIVRLDKMLGGKILSKVDDRRTERDLRVIGGQVVSRQRRVNPAVAGAMRAHAEFALPPNYDLLTPAEKKKIQKQMNKERRKR